MTVKLSTQLHKAIAPWMKEYGYRTTEDFVNDAVQHRLLELKKDQFVQHTKKIKQSLHKQHLTHDDILQDFEEARA